MEKFLGKHNLPILSQEEIKNMKRPIRNSEIGRVTYKLPTNKSPVPDGLRSEFYPSFNEELRLNL